jgi:hypothetical protein
MECKVLFLLGLGCVAHAGDEAVRTMSTAIVGNQEQPQMLFMVPWQAVSGSDTMSREFSTDLQSLYGMVERDTFVRELRFRNRVVSPGRTDDADEQLAVSDVSP